MRAVCHRAADGRTGPRLPHFCTPAPDKAPHRSSMALRSAAHASSAPFSAEERLSEAAVLVGFLAGATVQPLL